MTGILTQAVGLAIAVYRRSLGLILPTACRHSPSCSEYALQAFNSHGLMGGARLTAARFLRCHPFSKGGYDPVPPARG
jgi:hypothetical protein